MGKRSCSGAGSAMFFLPPFESSREGLRGDFVELRASSAGISGWNAEGVLSLSEARNPEGASSFCGCKGRIPSLLGGLCAFAFEGPYDIMWWRCSKETNVFFAFSWLQPQLFSSPIVFPGLRFEGKHMRLVHKGDGCFGACDFCWVRNWGPFP